jgi:sulfatase maturation enzyme AslB (radical SAM superfamily)
MLAGRRTEACRKCWNLEDQGIKSDRQIKNETLDFYFDQDIGSLCEMAQKNQAHRVHYKIDSNNTCNSTCVTCNSTYSSAWGDLQRRNGHPAGKTWTLKPADFDSSIDFAQARSVGFRGGEPLLSSTNFYILQQLIDHGNTDCLINFTTNGSIELTDKQKHILDQFNHVNVCFSIDGIGPVFEYLRFPLKWSQILENIDYCRKNNIIVSASYTVSNLNIMYHDQTCAWFRDNQIRFIVNPVYDPSHFRPGALPPAVKNKILSGPGNSELRSFLDQHSSADDLDYLRFQQEIQRQDQWKNISMQDYLPELAQLLG